MIRISEHMACALLFHVFSLHFFSRANTGRTVAGIILESLQRDRKKAIWVSVSPDLVEDTKRDLRDIGASRIAVHNLAKVNRRSIFVFSSLNV